VVPLSSGTAQAVPPTPREFDATLLDGALGHTDTLADMCSYFTTSNIPDAAHQAAFAAKEKVNLRFDPAPLPPLGLVSSIPFLGTIVGPPVLGGGLSFLLPEIVDQSTGLDVLLPSSEDDMIFTFNGDDVVLGMSGNDYICAGDGGDVILAGSGDDEIIGGSGEDVILGDSGDDNSDVDMADLLCYLGSGTNAGCA
jgi:Ca2+-binding RTX toxin-like protein